MTWIEFAQEAMENGLVGEGEYRDFLACLINNEVCYRYLRANSAGIVSVLDTSEVERESLVAMRKSFRRFWVDNQEYDYPYGDLSYFVDVDLPVAKVLYGSDVPLDIKETVANILVQYTNKDFGLLDPTTFEPILTEAEALAYIEYPRRGEIERMLCSEKLDPGEFEEAWREFPINNLFPYGIVEFDRGDSVEMTLRVTNNIISLWRARDGHAALQMHFEPLAAVLSRNLSQVVRARCVSDECSMFGDLISVLEGLEREEAGGDEEVKGGVQSRLLENIVSQLHRIDIGDLDTVIQHLATFCEENSPQVSRDTQEEVKDVLNNLDVTGLSARELLEYLRGISNLLY